MKERNEKLKEFVVSLPLQKDKNTIISAHNGVVENSWFSNIPNNGPGLELEEGGFYIISKKGGELILSMNLITLHILQELFPKVNE